MSVKIESTSSKKIRLSSIPSYFFKHLFNNQCRLCEEDLLKWGLCEKCLSSIQPEWHRFKKNGLGILSGVEYECAVRDILHRAKYSGARRTLFQLSQHLFNDLKIEEGYLVPIPLSKGRYRERGYNQAEVIAKALSQKLGFEVLPHLLKRKVFKGSQTKLSKEERKANLSSSLAMNKRFLSPSKKCLKVWLVDDIVTTGATLEAAAQVLKAHGFQVLGAITLARAISLIEMQKDDGGLAIFGPDYGFFK